VGPDLPDGLPESLGDHVRFFAAEPDPLGVPEIPPTAVGGGAARG
jgi:hypothetical protein